jgi:hypothetical protein
VSASALFAFALAGLFSAPSASVPPLRWPLLPSVSRVQVEVLRGHLVVTRDVTLPRGDFKAGDLTFHVAFGATVPFAMDARLLPVADGQLAPDREARGDALTLDRARRPALALFGTSEMAGVNVLLPHASFVRALAPGNMAVLRMRELRRLPPPAPDGTRELLVRLGAANGNPLTLSRVEVKRGESVSEVSNVSAHLCGKDADALPLYVARDGVSGADEPNAIAPVLATRHASDDLCVRFKM